MSGDDYFSFQNVTSESGSLSAELTVPDTYPFFEGHFPQDPILPAVCIIDASLSLLSRQVLNLNKEKVHLKRCRFAATIRPNERIVIVAKQESANNWKLEWLGDTPGSSDKKRTMAELNVLF